MVTHSPAFFRREASLSYGKEIIVIEEEILVKLLYIPLIF
jgi:hypothetical protein